MKYVIFIDGYRENSGGIKYMHKLCHLLNKNGQEAYVTTTKTNPSFNTPYYDNPLYDLDDSTIAVYPETIRGNMMGASRVVRMVLAKPGLLGGDNSFDKDEMVFAHSSLLSEHATTPEHILTLYPEDKHYGDYGWDRNERCYYIGKAARLKNPIEPNTIIGDLPDWIQIRSDYPPTNKKLKDLFRKSTVFYTFYAHTWLVMEAPLCGCPTVIIPDGEYTRKQYEREFPNLPGIAWGEEEIPRARKTVSEARALYDALRKKETDHIKRFIKLTSTW